MLALPQRTIRQLGVLAPTPRTDFSSNMKSMTVVPHSPATLGVPSRTKTASVLVSEALLFSRILSSVRRYEDSPLLPYGSADVGRFNISTTRECQKEVSTKFKSADSNLLHNIAYPCDLMLICVLAVHARGAGAHGVFTAYENFSNITAASFLGAPNKETPVFIRFSTVAGSRGSADTARDVHGFAVRFYTDEGNYGKIIISSLLQFQLLTTIRYCGKQCSRLLHPGCDSFPRSYPLGQANARS